VGRADHSNTCLKDKNLGLLGALVGGGIGFLLGGPLGAMVGGALGSQVGEPMWGDAEGPRRQFRPLLGRCSSCGNVVSFTPDEEELVCPRCGAHLRTGVRPDEGAQASYGAGTDARGGARGRSGGGAFGAGGFGFGGRRARNYRHERAWGADPRYARDQAQSAFMVALISLAAKVAKADGRVTRAEVRSFDQFLQNDLRMSANDRRIAARLFNEARDSDEPASEFAGQIRALLGHQPDRMRDLVCLLLKVALADGKLSRAENRLIRSIAKDLGLGDRDMEECLALFQRGDIDAAYALLGVAPSATDAEVRRAYRRLAKEYHPDVISQKGLSEEFEDFAKDKIRAVNEAYDQIKTTRGMK
jgi:DnaJ like chaperone protein